MSVTVISCRWCGETHGPRCPHVSAIEFAPDGTWDADRPNHYISRVEFFTIADVEGKKIAQPPPIEVDYPRLKPSAV